MYQPAEGAITDRFAFTARLEEEPSVCGVRAAGKEVTEQAEKVEERRQRGDPAEEERRGQSPC